MAAIICSHFFGRKNKTGNTIQIFTQLIIFASRQTEASRITDNELGN